MSPASLANRESQNHECRHGHELGPCRNVLQQGAPAQSHYIHEGEHADQDQGDEVSTREGDASECKHQVFLRNAGNDLPHVGGRCNRQGCDRTSIGHGKQHPAVKEGYEIAVCFAQVNILSARVGKH